MRALVLRSPENLEVMDVPRPVLSPGQVLIRVHQCGICGSDIRYFHGENPWAKQTLQKEIPNPPNIIFGHEFVGTVVEAADSANEDLVGRRVGVQTWLACGRCEFCRSGRENFCKGTRHLGHGQGWGTMDFFPGGMAEFCPAFAEGVRELPETVTDEQATFIDPLTAALHAVDVARPQIWDKAVVLGAGPIGLMIAQLAKAAGASETFITDVAESNLAVAAELGVDHMLNVATSQADIVDLVMASTDGRGAACVFNTVGSSETIVDSLRMLDCGGVVVLMATKEDRIDIPSLSISGERTLRTSTNAMYADLPRAIELLAAGQVKVDPLVTHRFDLADGVEAFDAACNKEQTGAIKIIIHCQQGE